MSADRDDLARVLYEADLAHHRAAAFAWYRDQADAALAWFAARAAAEGPDVEAVAGVLQEHQHDVVSYDAWCLDGCRCGWGPSPHGAEDAWGQHQRHQAEQIAALTPRVEP